MLRKIIRKNPVYEKELWASNRSAPFALAIIGFNLIMALTALAVFSNMLSYIRTHGQGNYAVMLQLYIVLAVVECLIVICIMPGMAGAGIAQERERRTLDLMQISGITPLQIVLGKQQAYMNTVVVLVLSGLPALTMVYVYGGIRGQDLLWISLVLLMISWYLCAVSLFCSAIARKTGHAVLIAYAVVFLLAGGTLLLHYYPLLLFGTAAYGEQIGSRIAWYHYPLLFNPLVTVYVILNQQAGSRDFLFDMINYQGNYRPNWVTDHWVMLSLCVQMLLAAFLLAATVRLVGRKR